MSREAGKGSKQRPSQIPDDEMALRWLMAFGTDLERVQAQAKFEELKSRRGNEPQTAAS